MASGDLEAGYDRTLLVGAPQANRTTRQEGYNAALLNRMPDPRFEPALDGKQETPGARSEEQLAFHPNRRKEDPQYVIPDSSSFDPNKAKTTSFWRTRRGVILLIVLAVVIVGAVVGGAVGGTVGKHHSSSNSSNDVESDEGVTSSIAVAPVESSASESSITTLLQQSTVTAISTATITKFVTFTVSPTSTSTDLLASSIDIPIDTATVTQAAPSANTTIFVIATRTVTV